MYFTLRIYIGVCVCGGKSDLIALHEFAIKIESHTGTTSES